MGSSTLRWKHWLKTKSSRQCLLRALEVCRNIALTSTPFLIIPTVAVSSESSSLLFPTHVPWILLVSPSHSWAHLPSSARHLPVESHSLQKPLSGGKLAGGWLLVPTLHIAMWPQTKDSPSLGLGFFLCQRSGLGRFLCRYDTLWIYLQSEIACNVSLSLSPSTLDNDF